MEPRRWTLTSAEEFARGTTEGVSISAAGHLLISPEVKTLLEPPEPIFSALAPGPRGSVFLGTASGGRILRVERNGEVETLAGGLGLQVSALASLGGGKLAAAWNPDGQVLLLEEGREPRLLHDPEATYVWALATDGDGGLLVATGDPARLFRVAIEDGEAEELLTLPEANLTALAVGPGGTIYVGTEGEGLVLSLEPGTAPRVLWDSPYRQIVALAPVPDGRLLAAAVARPEGAAEAGPLPSAVARLDPEGGEEEILWESPDEPVFSLTLAEVGGEGARVPVIGTGGKGRIHALPSADARTLLLDTDQEQVTALLDDGEGGLFAATANLARLLHLRRQRGGEGRYVSPVLDGGATSRWGAFVWEGHVPPGARLRFETRSGATGRPDETWSAWAPLEGRAVASPPARRLQWRALLRAGRGGASPHLDQVEVAWKQRNRSPRITRLTVHPQGLVYDKKLATESLEPEGPVRFSSKVDPSAKTKPFRLAGWRTLSWAAEDPNDDPLLFRLELRREEDRAWLPLAADLEVRAYAWDARSLPDGRYRARVTATDSPANPRGEARTAAKESESFLVDNTAPEIRQLTLFRRGSGWHLAFRAADPSDAVASAAVSVSGSRWRPIAPEDGICDESSERFSLPLAGVTEDDLVVVRVRDPSGNTASAATSAR